MRRSSRRPATVAEVGYDTARPGQDGSFVSVQHHTMHMAMAARSQVVLRMVAPSSMLSPTAPLLTASAVAAFRARHTMVGQSLSPPMLAFCVTLALSNVGALPMESPVYDMCASRALPLGVCLGLLSASPSELTVEERLEMRLNLRPMLIAFTIGAIGTVAGSLLAFRMCYPVLLPRLASACASGLMCATYIGGSANF